MSKPPIVANRPKNPFSAVVIAYFDKEGQFVSQAQAFDTEVWEVVLNVGAEDGVELKQKYVIFSLGEELFDPHTKESLGHFEHVRGHGEVTHLQERMCTVRSTDTRLQPRNALLPFSSKPSTESDWIRVGKPFAVISVGDYARRI